MAFQPVLNTVSIDVVYTLNGETVQNVFYGELPGGYILLDLQNVAAAIDLAVAANWLPQQPVEAVYRFTEVRGLAVVNDIAWTDATSTGVGGHASPTLPGNVTFSLKKLSGQTGRSARGRTYWIGIPQNQLLASDENRLNGTYQLAIEAAVDTIRTTIAAIGLWQPVLVSRFTGGLPRGSGLTFPWASTTSVDNILDTQRGRLPK